MDLLNEISAAGREWLGQYLTPRGQVQFWMIAQFAIGSVNGWLIAKWIHRRKHGRSPGRTRTP